MDARAWWWNARADGVAATDATDASGLGESGRGSVNATTAQGATTRQPTKTDAQRAATALPKPATPLAGASLASGEEEKGAGAPRRPRSGAGAPATDKPTPSVGTSEARPKAALRVI